MKGFNISKVSIKNSNDIDDIFKNIEEYNPKKCKILIVFHNMIADMLNNKNLNLVVTEYLSEIEN